MYSERINMLIDMAIADGEITDQEKRVLFKNAQEEGIDLDEFEMVLNAKLFEKQKELKQNATPIQSAPQKSNKYGDIKKCPQCGHVINGVEGLCPECGYAFSNIDANIHVASLSARLKAISDECFAKDYSARSKGSGLFGAVHAFLGEEENDDDRRANEINRRQAEVIKSFPVPTTKSDLFELMSTLWPIAKKGKSSNLMKSPYTNTKEDYEVLLQNAYVSKYEECLIKVKVLFPNDPVFSSFEAPKKKKLFGLF